MVVNPNAGLPECVNGVTFFNVTPEEFANDLKELAEMGVSLLGGCCGTTPEHLKEAVKLCKDIPVLPVKQKKHYSSYIILKNGCNRRKTYNNR
ncbi:MAG: homocysteine S-methyltransferase family protein [Acutalibacteraceae bacterium]